MKEGKVIQKAANEYMGEVADAASTTAADLRNPRLFFKKKRDLDPHTFRAAALELLE